MAAVFLAYDLRLNRKVAIKVMLPELAFHEGMEDRFKREARTAAKLDHPNIVVIYSVRDDAELLYFVMKLVEGASLEQLLRKYAPLPLSVAQHVLVQLAGALQYAHDEGVVHRDVKPANVLLDRRGSVLVTDFGIAKATESPNLTRTGSVIGTPAYMSPEQCMGNEQTHASDQYALGVVAYELIAGRPPFVGPAVELQWAHVKTEPPPLLAARPDCPPALADAVMRMLAKEPASRWPSLQDVVPAFAARLVPGDDSARAKLAEMIRVVAPVRTDSMAVTPASPIPSSRAATPARTPAATPAPPRPAPVASVEIARLTSPLEVGVTYQLVCTVRDAQGNDIAGAEVDWASSNPDVASITASGEVTAIALGRAIIAATAQTVSGTLTIEVVPDRVAEVVLSPSPLTLDERGSVRITIRANNARGKPITGRHATLRSTDPSVATVGADGVVTAKAAGRTSITATLDGQTTTTDVVVRPAKVATIAVMPQAPSVRAGDAIAFEATLRDATNHLLQGRKPTWRSSDAAVLAIDTNGRAVAAKAGVADVTAECDGVTKVVRVTIAPAPLVSFDLVVPASPIRVGKRARIHAKARDTTGRELEPDGVVWRSSDAAVATIASDGTVNAVAPGTATISAAFGERQARATVTIAPPPSRRVPIMVASGVGAVLLIVGAVSLLTRGGDDVQPPASNQPAGQQTPPKQSPPPEPASPQPQPPEPQPATEPQPEPATLGTPATLATLRVTSRSPLVIEVGQPSRVTVRALASDGQSVPGARITWSAAEPAIASVSANGVVTGRSEGRTSITARSGDITTSVEVVVSRPAPASVAVLPSASAIKVGEQTTLSARVRDGAGLALPYAVVWRSSNSGVATVDNTGSVRGVRQGEALVIAVAGGATDSARVTVTAATVAANTQPTNTQTTNPSSTYSTRPAEEKTGGTSAPTTAELQEALSSAARTIADGFARGQVGVLSATPQFAKMVRDDKPRLSGALVVQRPTFAAGKAEGDVTVPLRWKDFAGRDKPGSVVLHLVLDQQGGSWRVSSARNLTNP
jgi:serine/threonine-protein kinase